MKHHLLFLLVLSVFFPSFAWADWSAPLSTPPTCVAGNPGCDSPINVSADPQAKAGALTVGGLRSIVDVYALGNLGIGTEFPSTKLEVRGNASLLNQVWATANIFSLGSTVPVISLTRPASTGDMALNTWGGSAPTEKVRIKDSGAVGIGTTAPSGTLKLDVEGTVGATQYCDNNGANCVPPATLATLASGGSGLWAASGTNINNTNSGNVGIGTASPGAKLVVDDTAQPTYKSTLGFGGSVLSLNETGSSISTYPYIEWRKNGTRGAFLGWGSAGNWFDFALENGTNLSISGSSGNANVRILNNDWTSSNTWSMGSNVPLVSVVRPGNTGDLTLNTGNPPTEKVRIKDTGAVGIGTNNPTSKLQVNGDIKANSLTLQGQTVYGWPLSQFAVLQANNGQVASTGSSQFRFCLLTRVSVASVGGSCTLEPSGGIANAGSLSVWSLTASGSQCAAICFRNGDDSVI